MNQLPVGIIVFGKKKEVIEINQRATELLGDNPVEHKDNFDSIISQTPLSDDRFFGGTKHGTYRLELGAKHLVVSIQEINDGTIDSIVTLVDISDWDFYWRELNEQKESIRELEAIFNSSYDEIFVIDGKGITLRINKVGESYYGVPVETLVGKNIFELEKKAILPPR